MSDKKPLARLMLDNGTLLLLDADTGRWIGNDYRADHANALATLEDATPDKGHPVVWVVEAVKSVMGGTSQILVKPDDTDPDTIH